MTQKSLRKQFVSLLSIHGVSGQETQVRKYLKPKLDAMMDNVMVDNYGNLLAEKKFGTGEGAVVMLSAHMDTVKGVEKDRNLIEIDGFFMSDKGALGADDRAGIAIILEVVKNLNALSSFNGILKVAFSREEEIGCVGSYNINPEWYEDVDLAIVVDRRGTRDIVVGCGDPFCSNAVGEFMESVGKLIEQDDWECVEGGVSDAMTFSSNGINSINLSAGYENEHTSNEFASVEAMMDTTKLILQSLSVINNFYKTFGRVPISNSWIKPYKSGGYYSEREYSIANYLSPDYVSDDEDAEVFVLSEKEIMVKQGNDEIYLSEENMIFLEKVISRILETGGEVLWE
jgi:di/tripeptidase